MTEVMSYRALRLAVMLVAALSIGACAKNPLNPGDPALANASAAVPGSQQDFVVNVGDRVFFESDSSELTPQAVSTLEKQAQWLRSYHQYAFLIEGHADERGTREYNIALGARRAQAVRDYFASRGVQGNRPHRTKVFRTKTSCRHCDPRAAATVAVMPRKSFNDGRIARRRRRRT